MAPDSHPSPPSPDDPRMGAWRAFLYAQATLMARLDAELQAESGLTLAEFDALAQLAFAREHRLRMGELAERVLLSRSGVTRLVDRLERQGYVGREACAPDGRGAFAVLTEEGLKLLAAAMPAHLAGVSVHFLDAIGDHDLAAVERALGRVARANGRPLPSPEASAAAVDRVARSG